MNPAVWTFEGIGVPWTIETRETLLPNARRAIAEVIDSFDRDWSRFRPDSTVSVLGGQTGQIPAPQDAEVMLTAFAQASEATGGAVNPLIGASLEALGYDRQYSFTAGSAVPAPNDWQQLLSWSETTLTLTSPATIDIGALGKGRLVDRVLSEVRRWVSGGVVVDASGDIAVSGTSQRIGLEHPFDRRRAIGVATVTDAALCASATNRRSWGLGMHHVLDARTGQPVHTITATWAMHADAMHADALATALFFEGGPALASDWGAHWVRMSSSGRVDWSPDCPIDVFR